MSKETWEQCDSERSRLHDRIAELSTEVSNARKERDDWLWCYTLVQGILQRHPGWETAKEATVFHGNSGPVPLEAPTLAKQLNRELDWMRAELDRFKSLNAEKFETINAYCSMASFDKWKIEKLVDSIDQFLSANGYNEHTKGLEHARAEVINSKIGLLKVLPV